jgi:hypothetical protein
MINQTNHRPARIDKRYLKIKKRLKTVVHNRWVRHSLVFAMTRNSYQKQLVNTLRTTHKEILAVFGCLAQRWQYAKQPCEVSLKGYAGSAKGQPSYKLNAKQLSAND